MINRYLRAVGTAFCVVAVTAACGSGASKEEAGPAESEQAQELRSALLTDVDLASYRRQDVRAGTLDSLGFTQVFGQLRKLKTDKPQCLKGYLGGVSGPALDGLQQAPAAMAVFRGTQRGSFGQIILSLPAEKAAAALDQPFPDKCSKITATLPDGRKMTLKTREIDVAPLGEGARAFRGTVTVGGGQTVIMSETIRSGGVVQNIQMQGADKKTLEKLAKQAHQKVSEDLADLA
ncbi:MAG: hypothetical protein GEV03_05910 [Streptosporangiales bacterium]|nr:hypothetical protein [Streptosporangiales bacterium]